jgi:hypothetical protein
MSQRIQLNLRLDRHPEMYEIIQERAKLEGLSINDFAIDLLRQGLGLETGKTPIGEMRASIEAMEKRLTKLEGSLVGKPAA